MYLSNEKELQAAVQPAVRIKVMYMQNIEVLMYIASVFKFQNIDQLLSSHLWKLQVWLISVKCHSSGKSEKT